MRRRIPAGAVGDGLEGLPEGGLVEGVGTGGLGGELDHLLPAGPVVFLAVLVVLVEKACLLVAVAALAFYRLEELGEGHVSSLTRVCVPNSSCCRTGKGAGSMLWFGDQWGVAHWGARVAPGFSSARRVQSGLPTTLEFLLQLPNSGLSRVGAGPLYLLFVALRERDVECHGRQNMRSNSRPFTLSSIAVLCEAER